MEGFLMEFRSLEIGQASEVKEKAIAKNCENCFSDSHETSDCSSNHN